MIKAKAKCQIPARSTRSKSAEPGGAKRSKAKTATTVPLGQRQQTGREQPRRADSKQAQVLAMLQTANGTTIEKIAGVTGWQHHSIRGFLTAVIRKRLALDLVSDASAKGRVYRILDRPAPSVGVIETNKPV